MAPATSKYRIKNISKHFGLGKDPIIAFNDDPVAMMLSSYNLIDHFRGWINAPKILDHHSVNGYIDQYNQYPNARGYINRP